MSDSNTAATPGLRAIWIPVRDARGRTRMEMRWVGTQAPTHASVPQAA